MKGAKRWHSRDGDGPDAQAQDHLGHMVREPPKRVNSASSGATNDQANPHEHQRLQDTVVDDMKGRSGDAARGQRSQAKKHIPHLTDAGIGHDAFDVTCGQRHKCTIHFGCKSYYHQGELESTHAGHSQSRDGEPQDTVRAHAKHGGCQHHRDRHGRDRVSVRQPGMQWKDGQLHAETHQQERCEPGYLHLREPGELGRDDCEAGTSCIGDQQNECHQDEQRSNLRVDEILESHLRYTLTFAPTCQQQTRSHEHGLPEHEEQEHIFR